MVEIECDDDAVDEQLAYMDHAATQSLVPTVTLRLVARRTTNGYRLERDDVDIGTVATPREVLVAFFRAGYLTAFGAMPADVIMFHGVTIAAGDERLLFIAPSGSGKSTLAAHLALKGVDVLGDEYAVLVDGELTALPRRFHLKPGSMEHLPQLKAVLDASPLIDDGLGGWARSFDPADIGRPRHIAGGHLRAVVEIEPNHGGATDLDAVPQIDMALRMTTQTFAPDGRPGAWLERMCRALRGATTHRLRLGDVDAAFVALRPLLGLA